MLIKSKKEKKFFKISNEILVVGIIVKIYVSDDDDDNSNKWSTTKEKHLGIITCNLQVTN